mmetsp:Transcript_40180/g.119279  ORF Transcript_40180/g.119279 Transcript_40180/m.119279 type:complete len:208 (+) Transcript_40180:1329-1952(+)
MQASRHPRTAAADTAGGAMAGGAMADAAVAGAAGMVAAAAAVAELPRVPMATVARLRGMEAEAGRGATEAAADIAAREAAATAVAGATGAGPTKEAGSRRPRQSTQGTSRRAPGVVAAARAATTAMRPRGHRTAHRLLHTETPRARTGTSEAATAAGTVGSDSHTVFQSLGVAQAARPTPAMGHQARRRPMAISRTTGEDTEGGKKI